mmetsp:Transcript_16757/g.21517  ORF Transcript_16757/g.21517 Transcript_16757/m.21517 type:complete len:736 (-) Transcript_16757:37-2244(-)
MEENWSSCSDDDGALSVAELLNDLECGDLHKYDEEEDNSVRVDATGRVTDTFLRNLDAEEGRGQVTVATVSPRREGFTGAFHSGPRHWKSANSELLRMEECLKKKYAPVDNLIQQKRLLEKEQEKAKKRAQLAETQQHPACKGSTKPQSGVVTGGSFLNRTQSQQQEVPSQPKEKQPYRPLTPAVQNSIELEEFSPEYYPSGGKSIGDAVAAATYAVISGKTPTEQNGQKELHEELDAAEEISSSGNCCQEGTRAQRRGRQRRRRKSAPSHRKSRSLSSTRHPNQASSPSTLIDARKTNARFQLEEQKETLRAYHRKSEAKMRKLKLRIEGQTRAIRTLEHQLSTMNAQMEQMASENSALKQTVKNSRITSKDLSFLRNAKDTVGAAKKREEDLKLQLSECQRLLKEFRIREKRSKDTNSENKRLLLRSQKELRITQSEKQEIEKKYHSMKKEMAELRKGSKSRARSSERQRRLAAELVQEKELFQSETARLRAKLSECQEAGQASSFRERKLDGEVAELSGRVAALQDENSRLRDKIAVAEMRARSQTLVQQAARRHRDVSLFGDSRGNRSCPPNTELFSGPESDAESSDLSAPVFCSSSARDFEDLVHKKETLRRKVRSATKRPLPKHQDSQRLEASVGTESPMERRSESPTALRLIDRIKKGLLASSDKESPINSTTKNQQYLPPYPKNKIEEAEGRNHISSMRKENDHSMSQRYHRLQSMYDRVHGRSGSR